MNNKEAKDRLISLRMSYKIRIEEEDIEALDMGAEALENQKIGHWKSTTHYARPYRVCSVCGCEREDDHSTGWNYCPNCGAKIGGKSNE